MSKQALLKGEFGFELLVAAGGFCGAFDAFFDGGDVGKDEFEIDGLDVVERIDFSGHVGNIVVFETAYDLDDGVDFADVGEELVAEAFAGGGAADEAGDINELEGGRDGFLRFNEGGEDFETLIGNFNHAYVGLDGAEGVVGGLGLGRCDGVEQGALSDVGESDDSGLQWHGLVLGLSIWFGGDAGFQGRGYREGWGLLITNYELRITNCGAAEPR